MRTRRKYGPFQMKFSTLKLCVRNYIKIWLKLQKFDYKFYRGGDKGQTNVYRLMDSGSDSESNTLKLMSDDFFCML